uniref:Uncharacterized protein n=1 Tax=Anopheles funestus TaxID=62324 RepID=A0A4Y0BGN9_ANOFN
MKFSFGFLFVLAVLCSLFGAISADVCESKNPKAAAQACSMRCRAKNFDEGKCVNNKCECIKSEGSK